MLTCINTWCADLLQILKKVKARDIYFHKEKRMNDRSNAMCKQFTGLDDLENIVYYIYKYRMSDS